MNGTPEAYRRVLAKLESGESLSTRDFADLGYPFGMFLRYCAVPADQAKRAEDALARQLRAALTQSSRL